ncbi:alpha/beta fold hydrolase [Hugenholtzia roseola]|uniref:alpha/beta fold hydrolase n=1 Tax=Hugenholtzia roseola TaxID=1002 RepID=UPI0004024D40|nr:alpha/beta fold hydrolase [Hugenholtzia roseola]
MKHTLPDGLSLYYEFWEKEPQIPTLVFLNGLSQSTAAWTPFAKMFGKEFNILLVDLIFQGASDAGREYRSFEQHAADVAHLVEKLRKQGKVSQIVPIGISYGGAVAQRLMYQESETIARAILISTFAHRTPYFDFIGLGWRRSLLAGGYELMLDVMLPLVLGQEYFFNPLVPIEDLRKTRLLNNLDTQSLLKLMEATEKSGDFRPKLRHLNMPTLVVQGQDDPLTTPEMGRAIADALPKARFELIKHKGHTLNLEAIPELMALISDFLSPLSNSI